MPIEMEALEMSTRGLSRSEANLAHRLVRQYVDKLTRTHDVVTCRVAVEKPQRAQSTGNPYRVRVRVTAPGHTEVVVVRDTTDADMHDTMQMVIKEAFSGVTRQLEAELQRSRRRSKRHRPPVIGADEQPSAGLVVRIYRELDYGFIRGEDGREVYFHRNAVLHRGFDSLRTGSEVRFEVEQGEDGPQATSVQVMSQHGPLHEDDRAQANDPEAWKRHDE